MSAKTWGVLSCTIIAFFMVSSCTTPPVILGSPQEQDLKPLSQLIRPETKTIQLVLVHGVGDHCRNFALDNQTGWLNDDNLKAMGMVASGPTSPVFHESNAANLTSENGRLGRHDDISHITYQTRQYTLPLAGRKNGISIQAIEITWSPLTSWIKTRQLGYDSPSVVTNTQTMATDCVETSEVKGEQALPPPDRMLVNKALKEGLMDRNLADTLLYSGTYGKVIQRGIADVLCHVSTGDTSDTQCTWPTAIPSDIAESQYVFVTHSLGSRIIFDTLLNLRNYKDATERNPFLHWFRSNSDPTVLAGHILSNTAVVYMMANQLPMLGLANIDSTVNSGTGAQPYFDDPKRARAAQAFNGGTCASKLGQFAEARHESQAQVKNSDTDRSDKLYVVSFNDTNDLLTWHIPPWYSKAGDGPNECRSMIDLRNVFVQNGFHWLLFESPTDAHSGYFRKKAGWQAIACGGENGKLKDCLR